MPDGPLTNFVHTRNGATLSPAEFVETTHDPDTLYYYIQDAANKAEQDLTVDVGESELSVKLHAKVEVFQSVIQYVEAFGIYLTSYLQGNEDLIQHLVSTYPSDVTTLFEHMQDDTVRAWIDRNDVDEDYESVLETLFGYVYLTVDNTGRMDEQEATEEDLRDIISQSITVIKNELRDIGEFYIRFHDIYNAVKHGNRALPQGVSGVQMDGEEILGEDFEFVLFVCKNTNNKPYLAGVPIDYLIQYSLTIVERTHRLFKHLKVVSNAEITDDTFDVPFYNTTAPEHLRDDETSDEEYQDRDGEEETEDVEDTVDDFEQQSTSQRWITASHSSGIMILPFTEQLAEFQTEPRENTFAGRFEVNSGDLTIYTEMDEEQSEEYPIQVSLWQQGTVGLTPQPIIGLRIHMSVPVLDAVQYHELLRLQQLLDDDAFDSIVVRDEQADIEIPLGSPGEFPLPPLSDVLPMEHAEQVALLQRITQHRIPAPITVLDSQLDIIEECIEADLTRYDAVEAIEVIEELGQSEEVTEFFVDRLAPDGTVENSQFVGVVLGSIGISGESPSGVTFSNEGEEIRLPTTLTGTTYEELVNAIEEDPTALDDLISHIPTGVDEDIPSPPEVFVLSRNATEGFWTITHECRFQVAQ